MGRSSNILIEALDYQYMAITTTIEEVEHKLESLGEDLTAKRNYINAYLERIRYLLEDEELDDERREELKELQKEIKKKLSIDIIKGDPTITLKLGYETFQSSLEPVYYWLHDALKGGTFGFRYDVEKIKDEFAAAEASMFYGELGRRRTELEKRAGELMGTINMIVKSILNLIYDLKEFELRLDEYNKLHSDESAVAVSADYALKTIWLTEVDSKKGPGSINVLVQNLNYVMLRDAFFSVQIPVGEVDEIEKEVLKKIKSESELDVPDLVRRILQGRIKEYIKWRDISEKELKKRYKIERSYLKSQVNSLQLYTKWARPYLIATRKLLPMELGTADIGELPVTFNTMLTFLDLFAKKKVKIGEKTGSSKNIEVSKYISVKDDKEEEKDNDVYSIIEVKFIYRVVPGGQAQEGYRGHLGTVDITLIGYEMQAKDLENLKNKQQDEVMSFIDVGTKDTLEAIEDDIRKYLAEEDSEGKKYKKAVKTRNKLIKSIQTTYDTTQSHYNSIRKEVQKIANVVNEMGQFGIEQQKTWNTERLRKSAQEKSKKDVARLVYLYKKLHGMLVWE